jgi:hypothetical protein
MRPYTGTLSELEAIAPILRGQQFGCKSKLKENMPIQFKRRKRKRSDFQPDREYCAAAVDEYLKEGGKVTVIEIKGEEVIYKIKGEEDENI